MAEKIGWHFPPSGGGSDGGFNHSGIEHYSGNPEYYLAREIIQNSLDARANTRKPVVVRFGLVDIPKSKFPGQGQLLASFKACLKDEKGNDKAEKFFKEGIAALNRSVIPCLQISDSNTTGLRGKLERRGQWHNLTKAVGRSGSDKSDISGGSYGIGKNAPFTMSALRTVFYSTSYREGANRFYHCAQGKSILTSHNSEGLGLSQSDGFYGIVRDCRPIVGKQKIPSFLRREDEDGTTLVVTGFLSEGEWLDKIIAAIAGNFFCAIADRKLEVHVGGRVVRAKTLNSIFGDESLWGNLRETDMEFSPAYYRAMQEGIFWETQHKILGHVKLWVLVGDGLPKRTAIVRDTGMIITDKQSHFRFRGFNDYAALCVCEGADANKILRSMENPEHDRFEPGRLKADRDEGEKILRELRDWVRGRLSEVAIPQETDETSLPELAEMFPDTDVVEELPGENEDPDIEGDTIILGTPRPVRRRPKDMLLEEEDDDETESSQEGRSRKKRAARRGLGASHGGWEIVDPRIISYPEDPNRKTVKFTPMVSGAAKMKISVAGDSFSERMKTVDVGVLKASVRKSVDVVFSHPVSDALLVSVFPKKEES